MQIAMIGSGYVGLVSGVCLADFGHHVVCIDRNAHIITALQTGDIPIFEPGLKELVARGVSEGRLVFTTDLDQAIQKAEIIFIAVGTPLCKENDGHADLSYVLGAARSIARALRGGYVLIVTKSTVPVGTSRGVVSAILDERSDLMEGRDFDVVSNPEFLREGAAIEDFQRPDRVVVGATSQHAFNLMEQVYRPLYLLKTPMVLTTPETAELIKYAANGFLATKIAFINEIANLCERVGADIGDVAQGIGLDQRIGSKFLHAGPGYGGSCFPKDSLSLIRTAKEAGAPLSIVSAAADANDERKAGMATRILAALGGKTDGQHIAVLGLTFKPNTDDMRDSPSLIIIPALMAAGLRVRAHDPAGMAKAAAMIPGLECCGSPYMAMEGAAGVVILTEWNIYRALDLSRARALLAQPLMIDLRNIYTLDEMRSARFRYISLGRQVIDPRPTD